MVSGWSNFSYGSNAASECIGGIPDAQINFATAVNAFYCDSNGYTVDVLFIGGVLPVAWVTTIGRITPTGPRTARVKIHSAVDSSILYYGYKGDDDFFTTNTSTPACQDGIFSGGTGNAVAWLGRSLAVDGDINCRHSCSEVRGDCFGNILGGDDSNVPNELIFEPAECPYSTVTPNGNPYATPGQSLGPCSDASAVDFTYPEIYWHGSSYGACAHGAIDITGIGTQISSLFMTLGNGPQDIRHPNLKAAGCSPCALVQSMDIVISAIDAAGTVVIQDIPIN